MGIFHYKPSRNGGTPIYGKNHKKNIYTGTINMIEFRLILQRLLAGCLEENGEPEERNWDRLSRYGLPWSTHISKPHFGEVKLKLME